MESRVPGFRMNGAGTKEKEWIHHTAPTGRGGLTTRLCIPVPACKLGYGRGLRDSGVGLLLRLRPAYEWNGTLSTRAVRLVIRSRALLTAGEDGDKTESGVPKCFLLPATADLGRR